MSNQSLQPGTIVRSPKRAYTIRRVLGQGGFGITYLVDTPLKMGNITFKARFALKELFVNVYCHRRANSCEVGYDASKAQEIARFRRSFVSEAERLQRLGLNHQHIVNVDEVFEVNDTAYYVMEYLEGDTLEGFVAKHGGRLSFSQASALLRPICDAVAMLHTNNVAHYDIKPQNIIIQQDEEGSRPVLIDFGLAKHYDDKGNATSTGVTGFSLGYAPVEQLAGLTKFSPATDVYALAATFVFCLTGHAPAPAIELNRDALREELTNLGVDFVRTSALLKAMALLPTDRTPDAAAFRDVLFAVITEVTPVFSVPKPEEPTSDDEDEEILQAMEEDYSDMEQVEKSAPTPTYRTEPRNLDLEVQYGVDTHYYFSVDEWNSLPESEKREFRKSGLVIDYCGQRFVVGLNMYVEFKWLTYKRNFFWNEAIKISSQQSAGWHLPTKGQAQALAIQYKDVCRAIKAFGGDDNPALWYWTADKCDESSACKSSACTYSLYDGSIGHTITIFGGPIRFIRSIKCIDLFFDERPRRGLFL